MSEPTDKTSLPERAIRDSKGRNGLAVRPRRVATGGPGAGPFITVENAKRIRALRSGLLSGFWRMPGVHALNSVTFV